MSNDPKLLRLMKAVGDLIAEVTDCWAATVSDEGTVNMRVVEPMPRTSGENDWTICIATLGDSRKAAEIRHSGKLTLGYLHPVSRAYVALLGAAEVITDRAEVRARWQNPWRRFFPGGPDDLTTTFIRFKADRIECCIPDLTPNPFGSRYAVIERAEAGQWQIVSC